MLVANNRWTGGVRVGRNLSQLKMWRFRGRQGTSIWLKQRVYHALPTVPRILVLAQHTPSPWGLAVCPAQLFIERVCPANKRWEILGSLSASAPERSLKTAPSPLSNLFSFSLVKYRGEIKLPCFQDSLGLYIECPTLHESPSSGQAMIVDHPRQFLPFHPYHPPSWLLMVT